MTPELRVPPEDERCPIGDQLLGEIYRASAHGLNQLIATISPGTRALLALYCFRRAHLASIGLAIAATCEEDDLTSLGGNNGVALFERSREAPQSISTNPEPMAGEKLPWRPEHCANLACSRKSRIRAEY